MYKDRGALVYEAKIGEYPVQLFQKGCDRFTVVYGIRVYMEIDYNTAAHELGECLMHSLSLNGNLA